MRSLQNLFSDGFLIKNSASRILKEEKLLSRGLFRILRSLTLGNWKILKQVSSVSKLLCLRLTYSSSGISGSSSSIVAILFRLTCRRFNDGSPPSHPPRLLMLFCARYSSSNLGQFLKFDRFLNLLSKAEITLRFA